MIMIMITLMIIIIVMLFNIIEANAALIHHINSVTVIVYSYTYVVKYISIELNTISQLYDLYNLLSDKPKHSLVIGICTMWNEGLYNWHLSHFLKC